MSLSVSVALRVTCPLRVPIQEPERSIWKQTAQFLMAVLFRVAYRTRSRKLKPFVLNSLLEAISDPVERVAILTLSKWISPTGL